VANESIPLYRPGADLTCLTTAAVTGKTFVNVSGPVIPASGTLTRVATAVAAAKALGVAAYDAASGAEVAVILGGHIVPVTCGAAVTAGAEVEVGTTGRAITLAAGKAVGKALSTTTAADTDLFVQLY
jgi:hypothetical protein